MPLWATFNYERMGVSMLYHQKAFDEMSQFQYLAGIERAACEVERLYESAKLAIDREVENRNYQAAYEAFCAVQTLANCALNVRELKQWCKKS